MRSGFKTLASHFSISANFSHSSRHIANTCGIRTPPGRDFSNTLRLSGSTFQRTTGGHLRQLPSFSSETDIGIISGNITAFHRPPVSAKQESRTKFPYYLLKP
jgi:hypothetical protein